MTSGNLEPGGEFSPRFLYEQLLRRWWWAALCVILGALIGWGFSILRPPLYEARSTFSFNIDYTLTGLLTDVQEDQALEAAGDLLRSTDVKQRSMAALDKSGLHLTDAEIQASVFIERRNNSWLVIVRRPDIAQAQAIAAAWGESFNQVYQDAYRHALVADGLARYLKSVETCLRETTAVEPAQAGCRASDLAAVQAELARTGSELQKERLAAKNLFAGMLYDWSGRAEVSASPVWFGRSKFILFGGLAGFLLSLWLVEARPLRPGRRSTPAGE